MADKPKVIIKQDPKTGQWRDGEGKYAVSLLKPDKTDKVKP